MDLRLEKVWHQIWVSNPEKKIRDLPQELGTAYLGGGKNMSQNGNLPSFRGENKKELLETTNQISLVGVFQQISIRLAMQLH